MRNPLILLTLLSFLPLLTLPGCATVTDPNTGATRQELTPTGQVLVGLLVGSALIAVAASMDTGDEPDAVYQTTYSDGSTTTTEVYNR